MRSEDSLQEETRLFARGYCTLPTGLSEGDVYEVFTDDDIEWFDVNTRELRFHAMEAESPDIQCLKALLMLFSLSSPLLKISYLFASI